MPEYRSQQVITSVDTVDDEKYAKPRGAETVLRIDYVLAELGVQCEGKAPRNRLQSVGQRFEPTR